MDERNAILGRLPVIAIAIAVVALYLVPTVVTGTFWLHLFDMVLINAVLALGLNVILKTGQISLAHAAFMAIGAYMSAQLTVQLGLPFIVAFFAAGIGAALVALMMGRIILRLRGVYFILFTFALNEFAFLLSKDVEFLTGGNTGVIGIQAPSLPFLSEPLASKGDFYYLALTVFVLTLAGFAALYRSPLGRAMNAVRESQLLAESTGYDPMRVKVIAFAIGSLIAGFGGSLFAHFLRYIAPFNFTFWESVNFLLMNILGGGQSLLGPIIGAAVLTPLPELLRDYVIWQQMLYGIILMLFMRFIPDGIVGLLVGPARALWRGLRRTTSEDRSEGATAEP